MLTQTTKEIALNEFVARTSDPRNRRRLTSKLVEDSFAVAQQFVDAQSAYDAGNVIAPADRTKPAPSAVTVQLWDPESMLPMVRDGQPVMTTVTPDVDAWFPGLPFDHHLTKANLIGRLELCLPLPDINWTMDQEFAIAKLADEIGVPNPLETAV